MITVYVREVGELQGRFLGDFEPMNIAGVVQMIQDYPVYVQEGKAIFDEARLVVNEDLYGGAAVFEILVQSEAEP